MPRSWCDEAKRDSYVPRYSADGKQLCTRPGCEVALSGRKTRWCSKKCADDAYASWSYPAARWRVSERDNGLCKRCGVYDGAWECNHIMPICLGGSLCDLDNLETLCRKCHREHTNSIPQMKGDLKAARIKERA